MTPCRRQALHALLASTLPLLTAGVNSQPAQPAQPSSSGAPARMQPWTLDGLDAPLQWPSSGAATRSWLYLDFWASWCGPCRLSFPWMNRMHEQWQGQGLRIVAVSVDRRREDALGFLKANPARFQVGFDAQGSLARALDIKTMPTSLLVAPDGRILHRHEGFTASLGEKAAQAIKEAMQ